MRPLRSMLQTRSARRDRAGERLLLPVRSGEDAVFDLRYPSADVSRLADNAGGVEADTGVHFGGGDFR